MFGKVLKVIVLLAVILALSLSLTWYQKTTKSSNHNSISELFNNSEVYKVESILPEEHLLFGNLPKYVYLNHPGLSECVSFQVDTHLSKHLDKSMLNLVIHLTPVLTLVLWIMWVWLIIESVINFLLYWVYPILTLVFIGFLCKALIHEYLKPLNGIISFDIINVFNYIWPMFTFGSKGVN